MNFKQRNSHVFRRCVTLLAALAILLTTISIVGDTWAWFTDNRTARVSGIKSGIFKATLSIADANVTGSDGTYSAQLAGGNTYSVKITLGEETSVKNGYCEIRLDDELVGYTQNIVTPNGEYEFELYAGTRLKEPEQDGEEVVPLSNETDTESEKLPYTFTLKWGTGVTAVTYSLVGPMLVENGSTVNQYCEAIDPSLVPEPNKSGYTAAIEHNIPLYYQNDYTKNRYGAGTIATDGCGIVSLAMIAKAMTGYDYDIVSLARWFGGRAENNIKRMELAAETLGLPFVKAENINEATAALYDGKIVMMMMDGFNPNSQNPFTDSQHFIVVRGITTDGRYLVNDSNRNNYEKWELKSGFEKGFSFETIVAGYSGAWIFDPEAVAKDYKPYVKEEYPRQDNYPGVDLTFEEQQLIAKIIWCEAEGECAEGQQAIAEVVLNRLVSNGFGNSIAGIVTPDQFQGFVRMEKAAPGQAQYDALDAARYGKPVLPDKNVFYFSTNPPAGVETTQIEHHYFWRGTVETPAPETKPDTAPAPETKPEPETETESAPATEPKLGDADYAGPGYNILNYYQGDYPEVKYGAGTIATDGSSIVSLAMVARFLTRYEEYTPDMLAGLFPNASGDDVALLEAATSTLKLPGTTAESTDKIAELVAEKNVLILRLESTEENPSIFTEGVHFLVVRGVTDDGKYLVNDPCKDNYEKDTLAKGYEKGFALEDIQSACTNCWIFYPDAMADNYVLYTGA